MTKPEQLVREHAASIDAIAEVVERVLNQQQRQRIARILERVRCARVCGVAQPDIVTPADGDWNQE